MDYKLPDLITLVKKSEEYQTRCFQKRASRNINWYNGNYRGVDLKNSINIDLTDLNYYVNLVYMTSRTIVSSIYNRFPEFSFFLRGDLSKSILESYGVDIKFQTEKLERILEAMVKIYFTEMQVRRTNRLAITDAILMGFGVVKLGYNVDFDAEKYKLLKLNYNIPEVKWVELASNIEVSELVKACEPYLLRIDPFNILFPTDAPNFNRLSWQCEILYKDKDETEEMYGIKGKLSATYIDSFREKPINSNLKADKVKLYEFHSLDPSWPYICVFAEGYDKFLEKKEHPLYEKSSRHIKNMYQYLWFNESYDSIYPLSDIDLVEPQVREANYQIEKRVEHVRKFVRMLFLKGVFEEDEKLKLTTGEDGTYIQSMDGNAVIEAVPNAELTIDFYNNIMAIRNEIFEVLGLTDYAIGANTQNRKATEAQLMERSRVDRVQERIDIIEEFCFSQVDTFVEIMKNYDQIGRMFNLQIDDERVSMMLAGELLKMADIAITVVPGSTISLNRDAEINRIQKLFPVLANANAVQPGVVNMGKLLKSVLSKMGYSADEYINEQAPMIPQNMMGNVGKVNQPVNQAGVPTQTPMQLSQMPMTMGANG